MSAPQRGSRPAGMAQKAEMDKNLTNKECIMQKQAWQPQHLDFERSPYTGLDRESWLEAGKYLLAGIFQNIKSADDPVVMPRYETEVTYPNAHTPAHKVQAEYFEGLARSFFIAAPLLKNEPELTVCGFRLRDYYKNHILRACTPGDPLWVLDRAYMLAHDPENEYGIFQQTVEMAALVICLWVCREVIWDSYTQSERDRIAAFISEYAHGSTVPQNWRMFNMLGLAFLHREGYPIDRDIMRDHAQAILSLSVGDGWYRDGHSFDYYSCWAFNFYAPLWNLWYGCEEEPYLAARFAENSNCLMQTYADFFDRDGYTNMWGRSNIYRNGATAAFIGNLLLKSPTADPGLARRIASGSLLQFLTRDDLWYEGIPVLGFYRPFLPLVQSYSCAESPFWLAKAFMCLYLPAEHPFWTSAENNGSWEQLKPGESKVTTLDGPALSFINHQANGTTELRTGKVIKPEGDEHGMWNYAKLAYNTKFPWEAKPSPEVEAQQYVLYEEKSGVYKKGNALLWSGEKDGVLYRRNYLNYSTNREKHWIPSIDLADMAVPYGILRADKIRFFAKPLRLTLGAYGFPDNGTEILRREKDGAKAVILKGCGHTGQKRQLAMTILAGWQELEVLASSGTNADSQDSYIAYAALRREKEYGYEPYVLISQVLTKESWEDFSEDELFPLAEVRYADPEKCGGYGEVTLIFRDGTVRRIDYYGLEGRLSL